jgi:hypothetical protein
MIIIYNDILYNKNRFIGLFQKKIKAYKIYYNYSIVSTISIIIFKFQVAIFQIELYMHYYFIF